MRSDIMRGQFDEERELDAKIEIVKELLYTKMKGNVGSKDIEEINACLDKLIVNYLIN